MERDYSDAYADIYRRHWWWRAREDVVIETLRHFRSPYGTDTILDVGCGDGLMFDRLAEFGRVEGVEPEAAVISDRFRDCIYPVPFDQRFQPGKRYSILLMLDVLEHLPDASAAFSHALDLLESGGILLITVPAFPLLWTTHDDLNHHVRRYTRSSFRKLADNKPLEILEERYLFQALFPVKFALRGVQALLRPRPRVPSVPPTWLNALIGGYVRAEERVARKFGLPFGTSLLVVGKKRA